MKWNIYVLLKYQIQDKIFNSHENSLSMTIWNMEDLNIYWQPNIFKEQNMTNKNDSVKGLVIIKGNLNLILNEWLVQLFFETLIRYKIWKEGCGFYGGKMRTFGSTKHISSKDTIVTADCQADWNDKYVTKLVNEKLKIIGIGMKSIQVNRNIRKCFESCVVTIEPTKKKIIEQESFPIRRWTMKCIS